MLRKAYMFASRAGKSVIPGRFNRCVAARRAVSSHRAWSVDIHWSNFSAETEKSPTSPTWSAACGRQINRASAGSPSFRENMREVSSFVGQARHSICRQTMGRETSERPAPDASVSPNTKLASCRSPHDAGCLTTASPGASCSNSSMRPPSISCIALVSGLSSSLLVSALCTLIPLRVSFNKRPPHGQWQWDRLDDPARSHTSHSCSVSKWGTDSNHCITSQGRWTVIAVCMRKKFYACTHARGT
mmetsp:Transcript_55773/g.130764  ORF Transcript_55773/g.130764 Transcript_55773/m.130764 type:complete len:245 (-) Transcript_55773:7-741(-)